MRLFDTHVHVRDEHGRAETDAMVRRAAEAGVTGMVAVGGDAAMNRAAVAAAGRHPGRVWAAVGFDRDQAGEGGADVGAHLAAILDAARPDGVEAVAVGEIGLDFHYAPATAAEQCERFAAQLAVAAAHRMPVIVHSRDADEATLATLRAAAGGWGAGGTVPGVLHCFTGSAAFAQDLVALGLHISFSGILTFRNADALRAVARSVPDDRLLIETDTPYLAPVPHRGHRNEPAFVVEVARVLAEVRGTTLEAIANLTDANARRLFGAPDSGGV